MSLREGLVSGGESISEIPETVLAESVANDAVVAEDGLLEIVDAVITGYEDLMRPMRAQMQSVLKDKRLLVVDGAFGIPSDNMRHRLENIDKMGLTRTKDLLMQRLFGGEVPDSVTGFVAKYFGVEGNLLHHDINSGLADASGFDGLVLGGSPALVSRAESEESIFNRRHFSHAQVYDRMAAAHEIAVENGLPVLGICYGSHVLTRAHGGVVGNLLNQRQRMDRLNTGMGREFVDDCLGVEISDEGETYVAHQDASLGFGRASRVLAQVTDGEEVIPQFMIHLNDARYAFTGDNGTDANLMRDVMDNGGYAGLGIQGHFELAFPHLLMELISTRQDVGAFADIVKRMELTKETVGLVAGFFSAHRNFV